MSNLFTQRRKESNVLYQPNSYQYQNFEDAYLHNIGETKIAYVKEEGGKQMEIAKNKKMENEAIRRLELFGISQNLLDELKEDFNLKSSDPLGEGVHDINDFEKEILEQVLAMDYMKDIFPYYIIPSWQPDGYCIAILFISPEEDAWNDDIENLKDGCARAFVWNVGHPENNDVVLISIQRDGDALHHVPFWEALKKKHEKLYGNQNTASTQSNFRPFLRIHNLNINIPENIEIHFHMHTQD